MNKESTFQEALAEYNDTEFLDSEEVQNHPASKDELMGMVLMFRSHGYKAVFES